MIDQYSVQAITLLQVVMNVPHVETKFSQNMTSIVVNVVWSLSMTNNYNKRQEIAHKLRECKPIFDYHYDKVGADSVLFILGLRYEDIDRLEFSRSDVERLADLVESEKEYGCNIVIEEKKVSQTQTMIIKSCSSCGYVFGAEERRPIFPGFDEEITIGNVNIPNYCPQCGAKVIDSANQ